MEDVVWYCTNTADDSQRPKLGPDFEVTATLLKIVASHWNVLLEFIWAKLSEMERDVGLSQGSELARMTQILGNVHMIRRRLSWYYDQVEESLQSFGLPLNGQESEKDGEELLAVFARLSSCKEKIESLTPIVMGMLSVHQAEMSMQEAKLVSRLTFIALIFLPLSLVAAMFSMGADFLPGKPSFWIYFAVSLPLTLVILIFTYFFQWKQRHFTLARTRQSSQFWDLKHLGTKY